tara:strand:- start:356 stop:898 length:543 start_codon:yes stop_codon:yes gene_type:complete
MSLISKANKIKLIITDVDGVLTNGKIYIDNNKNEIKNFHVDDGAGVALARLADIPVAFLSGRYSESTSIRAKELKILFCIQGVLDKITAYKKIISHYKLKKENVCYIGDGLIDIPPIIESGLSITVPNAHSKIKNLSDYVTSKSGGEGVLLEVVELILDKQNRLEKIMDNMIKKIYCYDK